LRRYSLKIENKGQGFEAGKKAILEKDYLYWIPSKKIIEIEKNSQGLTTNIKMASGAGFLTINYSGSFKHITNKQGLSRVTHRLELKLAEGDDLGDRAEGLISGGTKISVLHVNRYGDGFFYGEDIGLPIIEFNDRLMVLEGAEDNVFYEVTNVCLKKVVPKTEQ
jgi:hypothetical protein